MKIFIIVLLSIFLVSCATTRAPFKMQVTDWSGNSKPYYISGESLNLHVWWDAKQDTGKPIDCSFSNSFNGEVIWRGVLIVPSSKPGQLVTNTVWTPVFPETGIKLAEGSYLAVCNFNNSAKASVALNVISVKAFKKT